MLLRASGIRALFVQERVIARYRESHDYYFLHERSSVDYRISISTSISFGTTAYSICMAALAEYLKKYSTDAGVSVKPKKKKKAGSKGFRDTSGGLRIVDADVLWQKDTRHESEDDEGEDMEMKCR